MSCGSRREDAEQNESTQSAGYLPLDDSFTVPSGRRGGALNSDIAAPILRTGASGTPCRPPAFWQRDL